MEVLLVLLQLAAITVLLYIGFKIKACFTHLDSQLQLQRLENRLQADITKSLSDEILESTLEIQHALSLMALGFKYPVFFGGWSVDSFLAKFLVQHMIVNKPKVVLELGSGSSTVLIAKCSEILGYKPEHIAVDHERYYLEQTKVVTELNGLSDRVEFMECSLGAVEGFESDWYQNLLQRIGDREIDLLIIDGPPGTICKLSRYPALPALYKHLSEKCLIVLDDASRPDEIAIVKKWSELYPEFQVNYMPEGHGVAILSRR